MFSFNGEGNMLVLLSICFFNELSVFASLN